MMLTSHLSLLISTFMVCLQLVLNKAQHPTPVEPLLQLITCATSAHSDIDSSQCLNPLQYYSGNQGVMVRSSREMTLLGPRSCCHSARRWRSIRQINLHS